MSFNGILSHKRKIDVLKICLSKLMNFKETYLCDAIKNTISEEETLFYKIERQEQNEVHKTDCQYTMLIKEVHKQKPETTFIYETIFASYVTVWFEREDIMQLQSRIKIVKNAIYELENKTL